MLYKYWELHEQLIAQAPQNLPFGLSILFAFLLSAFLTGAVAFIGFAYPTNRILPQHFYHVKRPNQLKRAYQVLGVEYFRKALMLFFWGTKKNRKKYFDGTKQGVANFLFQTRQSEFGHLAAFVIITIVSLHLLFLEYHALVLSLTLINIIGNFYPILLQRHHRARVSRFYNYQKAKTLNSSKE